MSGLKWIVSHWRAQQRDRRIISKSGLFDPSFYMQRYPDIRQAGVDPLRHYLDHGRFEQRAPCAGFEPNFYLRSNPDLATTGFDPFVHYILYGRVEHRPSSIPLQEAAKSDLELIAESGLFDPEYYRTLYLDVALSEKTPFDHYMLSGRQERRRPSADFDPAIYLAARPDVRTDGVDPLTHYVQLGRKEGPQQIQSGPGSSEIAKLSQLIKTSGLFDADHYLRQCPAVRDASVDPVLHYIIGGFAAFVHPSPAFAEIEYCKQKSGASKFAENPLVSYIEAKSRTGKAIVTASSCPADETIKFEIKAAETYFSRFRFNEDTGAESSNYVLDAIADLVCRKPSLEIDRMHPDASIIIPVFGQLPFVLNCLDSLHRHQSRWKVEIILADDASPESEKTRLLEAIPWLRYLRRDKNLGFLDNCNEAARMARGRILVFLNSDTRVVEGWLNELAEGFELYPKAGLIGSSFCNADGTLQEAGGIYWSDGTAWNYGRGDDPLHPKYCFARQVDYVSGASIAVPAVIWHRMEGFDTTYRPAYCEDADLAFRLKAAGYEVWLQPLSRVIHFEGKSHGRDVEQGVKQYQPLNMRKFAERWHDMLADHGVNGHNPDKAANRKARDRVLVIDATTPTPDRDSGSFITLRMMIMLQELGYQVTFVPEHNYSFDATYTAALQRRAIECLYAPHFRNIEDVLNFRDDFEVVITYRHNVLEAVYSKLRERLPSARLIFHNVDLHFLRIEREAVLHGQRSKKIAAANTRAVELELMAKADCTIVHTAEEVAVIRKHLALTNLVEFRYIAELHKSGVAFDKRFDILFLGGFRHPPNVDAVTHFATDVWPRLAQRLPDKAQFLIVGPDPPSEILALNGDRVRVTGYVPDLQPYFDRARVFVAPLRYGAGIKGKVIQSLSYGTPSVISTIAAEGIGIASGHQTIVSNGAEAFIDAVALLYSDKVLWYSLQSAGYEFVEEHFSHERGLRLISKALDLADTTWLARHNRTLDKRLKKLMANSPACLLEPAESMLSERPEY